MIKKDNTPDSAQFSSFELFYINHLRAFLFAVGEIIRTPFATLLTLLVIGIAMALPSALYLMLENFQGLAQHWDGTPHISLYLKVGTPEFEINQTIEQLKNQPEIAEINYISPTQGLADFEKITGLNGVLGSLNKNPLPGVIVITPAAEYQAPQPLEKLLASLKAQNSIETTALDMNWVKRLYYIIQIGERITYSLAALFGLGVIVIIGNTIRLTTQSNKQEIAVLRLIGATSGFIRRPLLYRGAFYGLFGGIIAWIIVSLLMWWLSEPLDNLAKSYGANIELNGFSFDSAIAIFTSCILLGLIGSWLAVSKHLRAEENL
jgi:cell division transport system permease protein